MSPDPYAPYLLRKLGEHGLHFTPRGAALYRAWRRAGDALDSEVGATLTALLGSAVFFAVILLAGAGR